MPDNLSPEMRSKIMRSVKSKNTRPELAVRKLLSAMGCRYRLHRRGLAGHPDIVFVRKKKAIFVHGCFWHAHRGCSFSHIPSSQFWQRKLSQNRERDKRSEEALKKLGWTSMVIWECEIPDFLTLKKRLARFLELRPETNYLVR
jgi:DNA mismatch endonuclease (patch repair protein)